MLGLLVLITINFLRICLAEKTVVIDLYTTNKTQLQDNDSGEQLASREMSGCFRMMSRYPRPFTLHFTEDLSLYFESSTHGFMNIQRKGYKLARLFSLCQPRLPGQWISMCISMRLTNDTQEIKVGQNGQICYERLFSDEQFDRLNYKNYNIMEGW